MLHIRTYFHTHIKTTTENTHPPTHTYTHKYIYSGTHVRSYTHINRFIFTRTPIQILKLVEVHVREGVINSFLRPYLRDIIQTSNSYVFLPQ